MKLIYFSWIALLPFIRSISFFGVKPIAISIVFLIFWLFKIKKRQSYLIFSAFVLIFTFAVFSLFSPNKVFDNFEAYLYVFIYIFISWVFFSDLTRNEVFSKIILKFTNLILVISIFGYFLALMDFSTTYSMWLSSTSRADLENSLASFAYLGKDMIFPRYSGYFLDPNRWGAFLFLYIFYISLFYKKKSIWLFFFPFVLLILTQSRGAILGFFIFIISLVYLSQIHSKWVSLSLKYLVFPLIAILFIVILYYSFPERFDLTSDLTSDRGRAAVWIYYISYLINNDFWVFGNGLEFITDKYYILGTHNTFLYVFFSFGLVGLTVFLMFFLFALFSSISFVRGNIGKVLFSGVLGFSVILATEDYFFTPHLWVFIAIVYSVIAQKSAFSFFGKS